MNVFTCFFSGFFICLFSAFFQVFDKDLVSGDDFMGFADFDLAACEIHKYQEVTLHIEDGGDENLIRSENMI